MRQSLPKVTRIDASIATVVQLRPMPEFFVLPEPFAVLIDKGGVAHAEDAIFASLEQIALKIEKLGQDWRASRFDTLDVDATQIIEIAEHIGFRSVTTASTHLRTAFETNDAVAIGATLGRLDRAFEALVSKIWDFFDSI